MVRSLWCSGQAQKQANKKATFLLRFCLPRFEQEGKSYLTVAVGCTGGRHRSVALAEALGRVLREAAASGLDVLHRDLGREASTAQSVRTGAW